MPDIILLCEIFALVCNHEIHMQRFNVLMLLIMCNIPNKTDFNYRITSVVLIVLSETKMWPIDPY